MDNEKKDLNKKNYKTIVNNRSRTKKLSQKKNKTPINTITIKTEKRNKNIIKLNKFGNQKRQNNKITLKKYSMDSKGLNIETNDIRNTLESNASDNLLNKKFKLRYSFPLFEKIIDKIINEYDNKEKININELSGSAYGNALELKIRENLKYLKEKIEIRKVWSLSEVSANVKKEKNNEIKKI